MRSISLKITLVLVIVSLVGGIIAAVYLQQRTQKAFDTFIRRRDQDVLVEALTDHYHANQSWKGVERVFRENQLLSTGAGMHGNPDAMGMGRQPGIPFLVASPDGMVLPGGGNLPGFLPGSTLPRELLQNSLELNLDGELVGYLVPIPGPRFRPSPQQDFMDTVQQGLLFSALISLLIALILGGILIQSFTRPIRKLAEGTDRIADGDLGTTVEIRSRDELGSLADSFNRMSRDLQRSDQARKQMTADIAHDLRTPLSVISGYTEALQDGKLSGSPETFQVMHQQAVQLNALVEDLRTLSLLDAGEFGFNMKKVQIQPLLDKTAAALRETARERQISIELEMDSDIPLIRLDPIRFTQVVENLLQNALQAVQEGGNILLKAAKEPGQVAVEVRDDGPGIPPEDLPHIFDRFYQVDKSRTDSGSSSGLGLAIARQLVEGQGGKISVESNPGKGTIFRIRFPVSQ